MIHHKRRYAAQANFQKQVNSLFSTIMAIQNDFLDHLSDLVSLDYWDSMDALVKEVVYALEDVDLKQCQESV